jgi:hypothetical protein
VALCCYLFYSLHIKRTSQLLTRLLYIFEKKTFFFIFYMWFSEWIIYKNVKFLFVLLLALIFISFLLKLDFLWVFNLQLEQKYANKRNYQVFIFLEAIQFYENFFGSQLCILSYRKKQLLEKKNTISLWEYLLGNDPPVNCKRVEPSMNAKINWHFITSFSYSM